MDRRTSEILERISDAHATLDREFRFTYVNAATERALGKSRDEILGRTLWDVFPRSVDAKFGDACRRVVTEGIEQHLMEHYVGEGNDAHLEIDAYPTDEGGAAVFWRDVTSEKAAAAERERLLAQSEAANKAKSGFLATMSHELRTPINAMIGYTELLDLGLAGPLTDQQRKYLDRLTASSQHLLGLVNDVLDLSKIDVGETSVSHRHTMTGPIIRAALDLVRPSAITRGVRLEDDRPDEEGVPFVGDDARTRQIALNLLANAVKFTPRGGTVSVRCGRQDETPSDATHLRGEGPWCFVRVEDTGIGISEEEQARIFEPFHQVDAGHRREHGGTGLGLTISRRLARLMAGDIVVQSAPGAGSIFTLWLPAAGTDPTGARETAENRRARAESERMLLGAAGLGEVGQALRAIGDDVLCSYADRLRVDAETPRARTMRSVAIEDHALSLIADLAQSLLMVDDAGPSATELLKDGSAIQRAIADAHGARRHAQEWDEKAVRRDHQVLREEVDRGVRAQFRSKLAPNADVDIDDAMHLLLGLIDRAEAISVRAWREAASEAGR